MANLFFLGLKSTGKTTMASLVSEKLSLLFSDADDLVREVIKPSSVREYYRKFGKEKFDLITLDEVSSFVNENNNFVMSLGGGAAENNALLEIAKKAGYLIYLRREEEILYPKVIKKGIPAFLDPKDPASSFHAVFIKRDEIYKKSASLTIEMGTYKDKEKEADYIIRSLKKEGYV